MKSISAGNTREQNNDRDRVRLWKWVVTTPYRKTPGLLFYPCSPTFDSFSIETVTGTSDNNETAVNRDVGGFDWEGETTKGCTANETCYPIRSPS